MNSAKSLSLIILCFACVLGEVVAAQEQAPAVAATPYVLDPESDYSIFAPWRALFDSDKIALGQVRGIFLSQDVVVGGTVEELGASSQFLDWRIATVSHGPAQTASQIAQETPQPRYMVPNATDGLPVRYRDKTGTVITIQLHNPEASGPRVNAMGSAASEDDAINPCFDLVVKFDDGTVAMTTQYPQTLGESNLVELTSVIKNGIERIKQELPAVVGKEVYAVGFTQLYRSDSTVDELFRQDDAKKLTAAEIPLLEPMSIVAARYVDSAGVVIEVELPKGGKALALTSKTLLFSTPERGEQQSLFDRMAGLLLAEIPHDLTKKEVAAIKSGSIYGGMREGALEYVLGFPDKESKGENGVRKLFFKNSLVVYVGPGGTVEDWKYIDAK